MAGLKRATWLRKLKRSLVAVGCAAACGGAAADPISLLTAVLATAFKTYTLAIVIGGMVLGAADARRKQRKAAAAARSAYNASLQDRAVTALTNESGWRVVYGQPAPIGGTLVAIHTSGDKDQFKHLVIVFAKHESQAIDEVYIEGVAVGAVDGSGWVTGADFREEIRDEQTSETVVLNSSGVGTLTNVPFPAEQLTVFGRVLTVVDEFGGTYPTVTSSGATITVEGGENKTVYVYYTYAVTVPRVNLQKHLSPGGVDTADAFLQARVPDKWTSAHRLSGYTYIVLTLDLNYSKFQGGPPNVSAKLRGKKVYDPRTGLTTYSNNNALCVVDFLMATYGMGAALAQIDSAAAIAAANACDAQGFTCDGRIDIEQGREANLQTLEDSMSGSTHFSGGVWRVMAGAWTSPVMSLTDSTTLAGAIEVLQASNPREGRFNGARARYVPIDALGVSQDMTPYNVASHLTADGAELLTDLVLPMTSTNAKAQKLAAIAVERSRLGLTINYPAHLSAWKLQPGERVTVSNAELGFVSKTFRIVDWTYIASAPVGFVLTEDLAAVYTGTFSTPDLQLATSNLVDPFARPAAPENLAAASGTAILQRASDGTILTRVLVTWTASVVRAVLQGGYAQLQWRRADGAGGGAWISQDLPADASSAYLLGPQDRDTILIRTRFVTGVGALGTWTNITHLVAGKTEAPPAPGYVSATQTLIFWGAVSATDLAGYRVRSFPGSTGAVWSRATPLHTDLIRASPWLITSKLYGVQTIMVVSEDTTGNQSAAVSSVVDFGSPAASNSVQSKDYSAQSWPIPFDINPIAAGTYAAYAAPNVHSCVRASAATYYDAAGLLQTAAANVARFTHDPSTLALQGLLVEGASTNLLQRSSEFDNAYWIKATGGTGVAPVVTPNVGTAPDGTTTADRVVFDKGAGTTLTDQSSISPSTALTTVVGQPYAFTVWMKTEDGSTKVVRVDFGGTTGTTSTVTVTGAWQRFEQRLASAADTTRRPFVRLRGTLGTADSATLHMWGAQFENATVASSYIPTAAAADSRAADLIAVSTGQSAWTRSGTSLVADADAASNRYALADVYGEPDNYATSYLPLVWVSEPFAPSYQGGTITLASTIAGASSAIEYQIDGSALTDHYAAADVYSSSDLYGASSAFAPWPGALTLNRMQGVIFRVSIAGGSVQGVISAFAASLVMPDVRQTFGNVVIAAAGTRMVPTAGTPARSWISIKTLQATPVVDGGGAIAGRVLDFSPSLGPLTQLVDITGTAVAGRATIDIGGLADD